MENLQSPSAESQPLENFFNIAFDSGTRAQIKQAAQWARICSLSAFIGYAIALIVAFFGRVSVDLDASVNAFSRSATVLGTLISVALGAIINYFLYRFAVSTAKGIDSMDSIKTNDGFNSLRVYFKIYGIILIIVLSLAALGLLFALIGFGLGSRG